MSALVAWLEPYPECVFAHLVAAAELERRQPAVRVFRDEREARAWVEREASELQARVDWR
jgi:hypothetical protein